MKKCKVCGSSNYKAAGYCVKHHSQINKYGRIFERTIFDKNEIIIFKNYCVMIVYCGNKPTSNTIFNNRHLRSISKIKWRLGSNGYIMGVKDGGYICLHQLIKGKIQGLIIDHIDQNPLNNLDDNLRFATKRQNAFNTNKTKGYYYSKRDRAFVAQIALNRKHIHLGQFKTKDEAIKAREEAVMRIWQ